MNLLVSTLLLISIAGSAWLLKAWYRREFPRRRPLSTLTLTLISAGVAGVAAFALIFALASRAPAPIIREIPQGLPTPPSVPVEPLPKPRDPIQGAIQDAFDNLPMASIAFNAPEAMALEETGGIELLLSLTEPVEVLQKQLTEIGKRHGAQIRVGTQVEATLLPVRKTAFEVAAIGPDTQNLRPDGNRWAWRITPLEAGAQELYLTVSAVYQVGGRDGRATMSTYRHNITVNVTPWKRIKAFGKNNWQWLWATLLIPAAGWLWKRSRRNPPSFKG